MCKILFHKLIYGSLWILSATTLSGQVFSELRHAKTFDLQDLMDQNIYNDALIKIRQDDTPPAAIMEEMEHKKIELYSSLKANAPEFLAKIGYYDKSYFRDNDINQVITELIKTQSSQNLIPGSKNIIEYAKSFGLSEKQVAGLQFFYGYELFREKNFHKAISAFKVSIDQDTEDKGHAHYYCAMAYLLTGDYARSLQHLNAIKQDKLYQSYIPFYAALCEYATDNYESIIRQYAHKSKDRNIHNKQGLNQLLAYVSFNKKEYSAAISYMSEAGKSKDKNDILLLALSHNMLGQYANTAALTESVNSLQTTIDQRLAFERAYALAQIGDNDRALYIFNNLINLGFETDIVGWNLALTHYKREEYDQALVTANKLINTSVAEYAKALIVVTADKVNDPALMARQVKELKNDPNNTSLIINNLYAQSLESIRQSDWNSARKTMDILYKLAPQSREYLRLQVLEGIEHFRQGDMLEAKSFFADYIRSPYKDEPNDFSIQCYYYLGYCYFKQREPADALDHFSKAMNLLNRTAESDDLRTDLYARIGDIHIIKNDLGKAKDAYIKLYESKKGQADYALYQLALISELKGNAYEQIIYLEDLIAQFPMSQLRYKAEFSSANALFDLGKYSRAEAHYKSIISHANDTKMKEASVMQLGLIHVNAGDYAQASHYYNKIVKESKQSHLIERAKEALKEIYSQYDINTEAYVAIALSETTTQTPDEIIWNLAEDNIAMNKNDIALDQLNQLIEKYPQSTKAPDAYYRIAALYQEQNMIDNAVKALVNALDKYPDNEKNIDTRSALSDLLSSHEKYYKDYLSYSDKGWFTTNKDLSQSDYLRKGQIYHHLDNDNALMLHLKQESDDDQITGYKEELSLKLLNGYLNKKDWKQVVQLDKELTGINHPKWIYSVSLALMNQNEYDDAISKISNNYQYLTDDSAWLVKSMLLLSDIYYLKGDKLSAIAALESILNTEIMIPEGIKKQVTDRLNDLNL